MRGSHVEGFERYRRRLPHWEEPGATYFLTATLHDRQLCDLSTPQLAPIIIGALRYFDGMRYDLYDYVVMPDHIHLILRIQEHDGRCEALSKITHSLYRWMARRINEVLAREGQLWQHENYDHIVRNREDYEEKARYIYDNPYTAGLVGEAGEWPWWGRGNGQ